MFMHVSFTLVFLNASKIAKCIILVKKTNKQKKTVPFSHVKHYPKFKRNQFMNIQMQANVKVTSKKIKRVEFCALDID